MAIVHRQFPNHLELDLKIMNLFAKNKKWLVNIFVGLFLCFAIFSPFSEASAYVDPRVVTPYYTSPSAPSPKPVENDCGVFNLQDCLILASAWAGTQVLKITALAVFLGGLMMDFAISFSITDFKTQIAGVGAIKDAWGTLRDFANMFFIFMLLYAAISMIIGRANDSKKVVMGVIIAALLINFSFFFTGLMIDASNTITVGVYNQIIKNAGGGTITISKAFMNGLGLQGIENIELSATDPLLTIITATSMGSVFFLITAFVFFAAGILFVIRSAILAFLLIVSPMAFAASGLPSEFGKNVSGKWWGALNANLIFAPMYMIMIFISIKVMQSVTGGTASNAGAENLGKLLAGATTQNGADGASLFNFVIIIIMMVMSLIVAKQVGVTGSSTINSWGRKKLDGLRTGTQGFVGRGALRAVGVNALDQKFKNSRFGNTYVGAGLRNITTGALVKQKFGSGDSIESVNKKEDKRREKLSDIKEEVVKAKYAKADEKVTAAQKKEDEIKNKIKEKQKSDSGVKTARYNERTYEEFLDRHRKTIRKKEEEIVANPTAPDIRTKKDDLSRLKAEEIAYVNNVENLKQVRIKEEDRVAATFSNDLAQAMWSRTGAKQQKAKMGTSEKDYLKNVADKMEKPKTVLGKLGKIGRRLAGVPVPLLIVAGIAGGGIPNLIIGGAAAGAVAMRNYEARKRRREAIKALRDASEGKKKKKGGGKATTSDQIDWDNVNDDEADKIEKEIADRKK